MLTPLVTIAMPCLDEAAFIEACLRSVQAQTYPRDRIEILVADGGSTDLTREILARLAAADSRIRVIDNPDRIQAAGLNRILAEARGDVIVRMDVHCEYAPDYVEKCITILERTGADNVGGAQRCRGRTEFEQAVCAALTSPLGVGGAAYRSSDNEGFVDTVFLGAYRRGVFDRIGPWDQGAITNEDAELNQRLVSAGGRIYLGREIVVHYTPRGSLGSLSCQYYRYGSGRARTLLKHRRFLSIRPALPFLAVATGLLLLVTLPWIEATLFVVAPAAVAFGLEAIRVGSSGGLRRAALVGVILPVIVASHGVGFGAGLARNLTLIARQRHGRERGA
jgi:glycosyltransferase involved in cell wall biosynthesis